MLSTKQSMLRGYTLIELMVTALILSILSAISSQPLSAWIESTKSRSVRQQLTAFLSESRSHALLESRVITICSLEFNECRADFDFPLSSFIDSNQNKIKDNGEAIIRVIDIDLSEHIRIVWNRADYLRFWSSGGTGALTGSLSYCSLRDPRNDFRLVISRVGRVRVDYGETRCPV